MTLNKKYSDSATLLFMVVMCVACASILSVVAYSLRIPQEEARLFDQNKQMLIAARILSHRGYFTTVDKQDKIVRAKLDEKKGELTPDPEAPPATDDEVRFLSEKLIHPLLTDKTGKVYTPEEKNIELSEYLEKNKKTGYADLPLKLFYAILPMEALTKNVEGKDVIEKLKEARAIVIPVNGFGLWDAIYGYLALKPDGDTVLGTTWYEMGETPGLGANITEAKWQDQFFGKKVFQEGGQGKTDFKSADLGIIVVKGKVSDVYGSSPKGKSAVDGMSGATLTGNGVSEAYKESLQPYRPFLIKLHDEKGEKKDG
jgi:Na+-transporting NADH:ubiquinone oxidoreductase subunit C